MINDSPEAATRPLWIARFVDPIDALTEILFGLIMVATFTVGAGLLVEEGPDAMRQLSIAIVGCNLAWGVIDGGLYVLTCLMEKSRKARMLDAIERAAGREEALAIIGQRLDETLEPIASAEDRQRLYEAILERLKGVAPAPTRIEWDDLRGALILALLTLLCTLPAVVPLLLIPDRFLALRVSNGLVLLALFGAGFRWARATHGRPWIFGGSLIALGLAAIGVAIALGG